MVDKPTIDPRQVNKVFTLMGSSFITGAGGLIDRLKPNQVLELRRQHNNEHDKNAVLVIWASRALGWVPRGLAAEIAPLMDAGVSVIVRKAPPLPRFGAFKGVFELAYVPPEEKKEDPNVANESSAGAPAEPGQGI